MLQVNRQHCHVALSLYCSSTCDLYATLINPQDPHFSKKVCHPISLLLAPASNRQMDLKYIRIYIAMMSWSRSLDLYHVRPGALRTLPNDIGHSRWCDISMQFTFCLALTSHMVFSIFENYANTIMVTKIVTMLVDPLCFCLVLPSNMCLVKNT